MTIFKIENRFGEARPRTWSDLEGLATSGAYGFLGCPLGMMERDIELFQHLQSNNQTRFISGDKVFTISEEE